MQMSLSKFIMKLLRDKPEIIKINEERVQIKAPKLKFKET